MSTLRPAFVPRDPYKQRNFADDVVARSAIVVDPQNTTLVRHQGVRYERTADQDEFLIEQAKGALTKNAYVHHSMASEQQWNFIQARLTQDSWVNNILNGRENGIQLPFTNHHYLDPELRIQKVNIHLPQPQCSYFEAVKTSQEQGRGYIEAVFKPVTTARDECVCEQKEVVDCHCGHYQFPFLSALTGNEVNCVNWNQPDRKCCPNLKACHLWGHVDEEWEDMIADVRLDLSAGDEKAKEEAKEAKEEEEEKNEEENEEEPEKTKFRPSDEAQQHLLGWHAQTQQYHAVVSHLCINNVILSDFLPAPVQLTVVTQAAPTFDIREHIPDDKLGHKLNREWKTWVPAHHSDSSVAYGLPRPGFVANGPHNRMDEKQMFDLNEVISERFHQLQEEMKHDRDCALRFYHEIANQVNSDLHADFSMRHLVFRADITPLNLAFYRNYANLSITQFVKEVLALPEQSQDSKTIIVACDTETIFDEKKEPVLGGVAPGTGNHLVATFIRELIQFATPETHLASSKQHCQKCQDAPPDQLHYHVKVDPIQLRNVRGGWSNATFRFDRRRFLKVMNAIITFLNDRLISFAGGVRVRACFQTIDRPTIMLDRELKRLVKYEKIIREWKTYERQNTAYHKQAKKTRIQEQKLQQLKEPVASPPVPPQRDLQNAIQQDSFTRLYNRGYWMSGLELQLGCCLLRPRIRQPVLLAQLEGEPNPTDPEDEELVV